MKKHKEDKPCSVAVKGDRTLAGSYYVHQNRYLIAIAQRNALRALLLIVLGLLKNNDLAHAVVDHAFPGEGLAKRIRRVLRDMGKGLP